MAIIPLPVSIPLLIQDASELLLGALIQPSWGVYLNGTPVIQPASYISQGSPFASPLISTIASFAGLIGGLTGFAGLANVISPAAASTVDFEYGQDFPLSNYPQEGGAFQSYNKVQLPFDVKLKLASSGSASARQAFLSTCQAISSSIALFSVVTPEQVFSNVNCTHIDWRRSAQQGVTLIMVDLWFNQVPVISATNFQNTQLPGDAGQQANGNVQTTTPSSYVNANFGAFQ